MKPTLFVILFTIFGLFSSCDKDDDPQREVPQEAVIAGAWNLTAIKGGFAGINESYEPGKITWIFQAETATLKVINNHTDDSSIYDGFETGTYSYSVSKNEANAIVHIDGTKFGIYTIDAQKMTIDAYYGADGYLYSFER